MQNMERDLSDVDAPSTERRSVRANRACATCRARKQRCVPSGPLDAPNPCQRCARQRMSCSFETEPPGLNQEEPGPLRLAQMIVELQQRANRHEVRITELEQREHPPRKLRRLTQDGNASPIVARLPEVSAVAEPEVELELQPATQRRDYAAPTPQNTEFSMNQLELDAPIATLRSLGASGRQQTSHPELRHHGYQLPSSFDPISRGILTEQDAQRAFDIYFEHCHPWAPVLEENTRYRGTSLRVQAPTLFLTIVSVGVRFWPENELSAQPSSLSGLHPRYFQLIEVLDAAISRLLLQPSAADASLDTIQSLMVYLQWMPYNSSTPGSISIDASANFHQNSFTTRYNDMSSWAIFGLALRYASYVGLAQGAVTPFEPSNPSVTTQDMTRMRVWLNMVTYDCNLTLTSGLPVSLDPGPTRLVVYKFCSQQSAQQPGDLRYASMAELALIVQRARAEKGRFSSQHDAITSIKKANVDFDDWEIQWSDRLKGTRMQHTHMPFTSVRWYRLALNSSLLRPFLSPSHGRKTQPETLPIWALGLLEITLTAASQILFSVSSYASQHVSSISSQNPSTFPSGDFLVDPKARESLHHAVDSTWVSHTFAITFLVLCYARNTINDDLRICSFTPAPSPSASMIPSRPRPSSLLARLARLALEIFGGTKRPSTFRPENDYAIIVQNATSLVLPESLLEAETTQVPTDSLQALFNLMDDPAWDWGVPLGGLENEWTMSCDMPS